MGQGNTVTVRAERIHRLENWPSLLSAYLHEKRRTAFEWGVCDCLLFASGGVNAITGIDYAAPFRGTYKDEAGAKKVIDDHFGGSITQIGYHYFGDPIPYPHLAARGDLVARDFSIGTTFGIIDDTGQRAAFMTEIGLVKYKIDPTMIIWSVG